MSTSESPHPAIYVPAFTTHCQQMAQTLVAPIIPPPPTWTYQRRTPQPLRLPPLRIPRSPQAESQHHQYGVPPRLPALQSITGQSSGQPMNTSSTRSRSSARAAPISDLLSPLPDTPTRSDTGHSPYYETRRSPARSYMDEAMSSMHSAGNIIAQPAPLRPARFESAYTSPVESSNRSQPAVMPSPSYPPSYETGTNARRTPYVAHRSSFGSSSVVLAPAEPPQASSATFTASSSQEVRLDRSPLQYELRVRQQPIAARACGFGERDRRVIDPPPIIQLIARDPRTGTVDLDELRYSLNIVHCTLWSEDGLSEQTALQQPDRRTTRRLMGQLVASPSVAKDEHDIEGCFFCFPDLSCRTHGRYRLRFVLIRLDPANLRVGSFSPILTAVLSDVFAVYTAKDFPGMRPSSALTRALKLQGCNIQVKKGNEKALARKRQSIDDGYEDKEGMERLKRRNGSA